MWPGGCVVVVTQCMVRPEISATAGFCTSHSPHSIRAYLHKHVHCLFLQMVVCSPGVKTLAHSSVTVPTPPAYPLLV